jgi:hypothetical protein
LPAYEGPDADPLRYTCVLSLSLTTPDHITCLTQQNSQGISLRFTVTAATASFRGHDTLNYPTIQPNVTSISGCTDVGIETRACPTAGNVTVAVHGARFFEPLSVFVSAMAVLLCV